MKKNSLWSKIYKLYKKRKNHYGRVIKPMTIAERMLRKQAKLRKGTTAKGKAIMRGLKFHKFALKKAARNRIIKRQRENTLKRLYH